MARQIHLNVGGRLFVTTEHTLCREPDSYFTALLRNGWSESKSAVQECKLAAEHAAVQESKPAEIFVDQDPDCSGISWTT